MCGIAAAIGLEPASARAAVEAMCDRMEARGPDDAGVEALDGAVLGAQRLAIIDPTPGGHQPMRDDERGLTLVFNGMIYNFRELRARLEAEGERFRSDCDSEVLLRAYGRWGPAAVERLVGMFAFCIWDERRRELFLARDRLGIKPLYYARRDGGLVAASQVKALLASGLVGRRVSEPALRSYLAFGAVSEPLTAIDGVEALPAGHAATFRGGTLDVHRYWTPPEAEERPVSRAEAARELRALLERTVGSHLVSDAPLGVFLSGGLDSSVVAAVAARATDRLRTVSVAFDDARFSEAPYMDLVARELGSEHVRVTLTADELLGALDGAFEAMDQPSFDGVNTYVVSRAAAESGLKVALSGLGGDELFDGYGYRRRVAALERVRRLPAPVAAAAPRVVRGRQREKVGAWVSGSWEAGSSYELLRRNFLPAEVAELDGGENGFPRPGRVDVSGDLFNQVSALDLTSYTKNVLLRDTDAMSMANSLEVRVPYLDHPLVEWALRLPERVKAGRGKAFLVAAVRDLLPPAVLGRRKHGFLLPLGEWMRGPLRTEVEERLREPPAGLDPGATSAVWQRYLANGTGWLGPWSLYALARWCETL